MNHMADACWMPFCWLGCLGLAGAPLLAQRAELFEYRVQPTEETVDYTIYFTTAFHYPDALPPKSAVSAERQDTTRVRLWLGDYRVSGPDSAVAAMISVRVTLPETIPGETIFLSSLMREGSTPAFPARIGDRVAETGSVTISYAGREVTRTIIGFAHTIDPPQPSPKLVLNKEEGAFPSSPPAGSTKPSQREEAYQLDYRQLSPEAFIKKWPGQRSLVRSALERIPLRAQVEEIATNVYELRLPYVRAARIDSVTGGQRYSILADEADPPHGHRFVVEVSDTGLYRLHLSDTTKYQGSTIVTLDNLLAGTFEQSADSAIFTFHGGHPPYMLLFLRNGAPITDYELGNDTVWHADLASLRTLIGTAGSYGMQLTDSQRSVTWNFGGAQLQLEPPHRPLTDFRVPLAVLAALVLFGVGYGLHKRRQKRRGRLIREKLQTEASRLSHNSGSYPSESVVGSIANGTRLRENRRPATVPVGFRVTKRDVRDRFNGRFNPDETPDQFLSLDLAELWSASRVSELLFGKVAIAALDSFLRKENIDKIIAAGRNEAGESWERNEDIPEIGGMLMGQYQPDANGQRYRVSVEQFIPLAARVQNLVKMEIDPMSLARDLSQAQDDHPHLTVVGWFHTHPGHGLFLSQPDLKVQYNHFRKPYHFAMEIDSLTNQLETAFFTYMPNERMNNRDTRRHDRGWFSWTEIEKFSRQQTNSLP
ncbi:JAB1/Mov34/MPN/PAD-1 ubiquitin protease [Neolewinella xylanilytica]|uniref:JAB1/Mov34/MPN/PAD-1 ubiquitin protease n=2 Tax=Neolewinella xylanilytica TaxID=1514080 RepID=A0A2S6IB97_9BACT|nr:JAB1/Mov34/MPN/PAD-1 ubiquitin protease [Neolewinella xylanilytica]